MWYKKVILSVMLLLFMTTMAMAQFDGGFGGGGMPPMGEGMGPMGQNGTTQNTSQRRKSLTEGVDISSLSIIDEAQSTKLMEQLKKTIERHNKKLLSKFDTNKDGQLDKTELKAWKKWLSEQGSTEGMSGDHFGGMPAFSPDSLGHHNGMPGQPGNGGGFPMQGMAQANPSISPSAVSLVTTKSALKEQTITALKSNESAVRVQKGGDLYRRRYYDKKGWWRYNFWRREQLLWSQCCLCCRNRCYCHTRTGGNISTNAEGANAVFAYGKDAKITVNNICINTLKNSSRGLDATFGGSVTGSDVTITTQGAHCAALATDRGEGTIKVSGCNATTHGEGSPGIYSTGTISADNSVFYAAGSEAAVIEGRNSIALDNCTLTGMKNWGVMLYQSFSGDAGVGTSSIVMKNSRLNVAEGPIFYCTNTKTSITLDGNKLLGQSGTLLQAASNNRWGLKRTKRSTSHLESHQPATLRNYISR
jgi:hypothetical protein